MEPPQKVKLSIIMLIRSAGCFGYFQIFGNLEIFLSWPECHIWWAVIQVLANISVISCSFFKFFLLKIGLISIYKLPPHLACYLIRVLSNLSGNVWIFVNSLYCPPSALADMVCKWACDITAYVMRVIFVCWPRIPIFQIFGLKYLSTLIR